MIKFEYKPAQPDKTWGYAQDIPPVEEITMTLGDDVSWDEATKEFHNFLRSAGYVIPYDFEEEDKEEDDWRCWTPMTFEEIQDLERKHQTRYDGVAEPYFDRMGFATDIENRLKELNT